MSNRHVPLIIGGTCIGAAIWLLVGVSGWWRYIPGTLLLGFGWVSLKSGLLASAREIDELTGSRPTSEETAMAFQDRIEDRIPSGQQDRVPVACDIHVDDKYLVCAEDMEWWNGLSTDDITALQQEDTVFRSATFIKLTERDGLSAAEAGKKIRLGFPTYYWKIDLRADEKFPVSKADAMLPVVLKGRINRAVVSGLLKREALAKTSSVNALVRQLFGRQIPSKNGSSAGETVARATDTASAVVARPNNRITYSNNQITYSSTVPRIRWGSDYSIGSGLQVTAEVPSSIQPHTVSSRPRGEDSQSVVKADDHAHRNSYQVAVANIVQAARAIEIFDSEAFDDCTKDALEASIAILWMTVRSLYGLGERNFQRASEFAIQFTFEIWRSDYFAEEFETFVLPLLARRMEQYDETFTLAQKEEQQTPVLRICKTIVQNVTGEEDEPHIAQIMAVNLIGWQTISLLGAELVLLDDREMINWGYPATRMDQEHIEQDSTPMTHAQSTPSEDPVRRVLNNRLTLDKAHYVMPRLPSDLTNDEGIMPWNIVIDPKVGTETALLLLDRTPFINALAKVRPFDLRLKSGLVRTAHGPFFFLLFHVPDPNRPGTEFSAIDVHVNPYDPKHMTFWRNLAWQTHWHLLLLGVGDKLVDLFEFPNTFELGKVLDQVEAVCEKVPHGSFDDAKAEFCAKYTIDDLMRM